MPSKSRGDSSRGKKKKRKPDRPAWMIPAIAGGGLSLCLIVALIVWLSSGRGGGAGGGAKGGGGDGGGGNAAEAGNPERGIAPAREPQAGPDSWMATAVPDSATPDQWKVKVDPPAARAGELRSFIPMPAEKGFKPYGYALQANCSQLAVFGPGINKDIAAYEWIRYDLTKAEPLGRVRLFEAGNTADHPVPKYEKGEKALAAALSPSGRRVVVEDARNNPVGTGFQIWDADGKRVGRIGVPIDRGEAISWVCFGGDDRVWTVSGRLLTQWDVQTGKPTVEIKDYTGGHPGLSPGGKTLAAFLQGRIALLDAIDGTEIGTLPCKDKPGKGGVAFDPTGRLLALSSFTTRYHTAMAVYDVATGQRTNSVDVYTPDGDYDGGIEWVGNRQVAVLYKTSGGVVLDLDLNAIASHLTAALGKLHLPGTPTPDARHWQMRNFHQAELTKLEGKLPKADGVTSDWCLAAAALPKEYFDTLDKARNGGLLWHPGVPVKLTVSGNLIEKNKDHLAKIVEASADSSAKLGYRIDPNAELNLDLNIIAFTNGELGCKSVLRKNGKPVLESSGHVIMKSGPLTTHGAKPMDISKLFFRDANLRQLVLPNQITPGVDGLLDPILMIPRPQRDPLGPPD